MNQQKVLKRGDFVTWHESRAWGGKQNQPATFIRYAGEKSARIKVDGETKERTVRLVCLSRH